MVCVYVNIAPALPSTNPGKTNPQYLPGASAHANNTVAPTNNVSAPRMIHFELTTRDNAPVKLIANARTPMGIMCSAVEMADQR